MSTETLTVHILGKDYQVSCPSDERESLIRAASELDRRMKTIRQSGAVLGLERIAVMAALNLSHEVLDMSHNKIDEQQEAENNQLIGDMCQRVDALFSRQ